MKKSIIDKHIDALVANDFLFFILEKWRISSGEHLGEPYSFRERPYMKGIVEDNFHNVVIQKSAQCGISEVEVARAIWNAIYRKRNVLYTMPAGEQMQQFVDSRARNAIVNSDFLSQHVTGSLNLKKFSIANHQIYFRGVQKRRQIISVDVSTLCADELDEYEEGTLNTLEKRLGASKTPEKHMFSTPSFHGTGVSLLYYGSDALREKGSDQRVWTIKCSHCGQWNEDLYWETNVIDLNEKDNKSSYYEPNVIVICRFCKKEIDRLTANAEWVAKNPSITGTCHGYHISKLFSPTGNLNQMWLDSQNPIKEQEFYNSDLGMPYEPRGSRLTDDAILSATGTHLTVRKSDTPTYAGVDIGKKIHMIVAENDSNNRIKVIAAMELDDWTELHLVAQDFKVGGMVIDMNPEKDEAVKFQKKHDNAWLAYYAQHLETKVEKFVKNYDDQVVALNRTLMMMLTSDMVMDKNVIFPLDLRRVRDFYEHLKSPIKAQKQSAQGEWVTFYPKTKNPDHYYHALLYTLMASQLRSRPALVKFVSTLLR